MECGFSERSYAVMVSSEAEGLIFGAWISTSSNWNGGPVPVEFDFACPCPDLAGPAVLVAAPRVGGILAGEAGDADELDDGACCASAGKASVYIAATTHIRAKRNDIAIR